MVVTLKKRMLKDRLVLIYTFLFIYTSICRQFHFAGFMDMRYVTLILGMMLIGGNIVTNFDFKFNFHKKNIWLFAYFLLVIASNIMWLFNKIKINEEGFQKLIILFIFNICGIIFFSIYKDAIELEFIWKCIFFSTIILLISMYLAYGGVDMEVIWGSGLKGKNIIEESSNLTKNLLGKNVRAAGYAEDPNYATLFMMLGILSAFKVLRGQIKYFFSLMFVSGIIIANSNTVIISIVIAVLIIILIYAIKNSEKIIISVLFIGIVMSFILLPHFRVGDSLLTLSSRYNMWENAKNLFLSSPLLGSGLSSFRCIHTWYVHCHSTYWQMLCENGILALTCFVVYYMKTFFCVKDESVKFILICYCIFCMMFDMSYMQITVVIIYLLPEVEWNGKTKKAKSIVLY